MCTNLSTTECYTRLRHSEPLAKDKRAKWHVQLKEYCSKVTELAAQIQTGGVDATLNLKGIHDNLDKIKGRTTSYQAKQWIQQSQQSLFFAEQAAKEAAQREVDLILSNGRPTQSRWPGISSLTSFRNLFAFGLFCFSSLGIAAAKPAAARPASFNPPNEPKGVEPSSATPKPCNGVVVSAVLKGGLGDQLFQVAHAYSRASDSGAEAVFPNENLVRTSPVLSRVSRFEGPTPKLPRIDQIDGPMSTEPAKEQSRQYQGLFQSLSLFNHHQKELVDLFRAPPEINAHLQAKHKDLLSQNTVAIHIRRGDYLTFKNDGRLVLNNLSEDGRYYREAISNFDIDEHHFVIFSDDIEFVKNMPELRGLKHITFISGQQEHEDFFLMRLCKHFIIANSTFSWWAAYLSENPSKKVIAPLEWYHPETAKIRNPHASQPCAKNKIIPPDWIRVGKENCLLESPVVSKPCSGILVSARLENGIGNQLFQIAHAFVRALDAGAEAAFPNVGVEHVGTSPILSRVPRFERRMPQLPQLDPTQSIPLQSGVYKGLFQSVDLIHHRRKELVELFKAPPEISSHLQKKYKDLLSKNTVSVHIRRGDYLSFKINGNRVLSSLSEDGDYYRAALSNFDIDKHHFVIFSDDIEFAKTMPELRGLKNITFISGQPAHEDFYLMTFCKNHIIANSTFSWWAAYLGENPNKKVVAPINWQHPEIAKIRNPHGRHPCAKLQLMPPEWIIAGKENCPLA
jgi:hypothetical protein